jgi:hypothetical protein
MCARNCGHVWSEGGGSFACRVVWVWSPPAAVNLTSGMPNVWEENFFLVDETNAAARAAIFNAVWCLHARAALWCGAVRAC